MSRRGPPFRAEHLGSLLRPDDLLAKRNAFEEKKCSEADLKPVEDSAIQKAVEMQKKSGIGPITDGEYRRHQFWGNLFPNLIGMEPIYDPPMSMFRAYAPDIKAFAEGGHNIGESIICVDKIKHSGTSVMLPEFEYVKTLVPQDEWKRIKLTLPSPNWYHFRYMEGKAYPKDVYASDAQYFADIAKAYQAELDILYKAGLRNVQFDDPNLAYFCSEKFRAGFAADSTNPGTPDDLFEAYIGLYNGCIERIPSDLHVGVHMCRGNFRKSRHFSEGGYERIATAMFAKLNAHTFYLEYDTERCGGFEPLAALPAAKNVVLGVVTSKFAPLEKVPDMVARVMEAADVVARGDKQRGEGPGGEEGRKKALGRMGVSPQCGFASHKDGNDLGWDDMVGKLELVRKIAAEIWPGEM